MILNPDPRPLSLKFDMRSTFTPLSHSTISRLATVVLVALALGSPACSGQILEAARNGDLETVKALISDNPDLVFSNDDYGNTSLHWAASWDHKDVVQLLLARNADVNARDNGGFTPLRLAALKGYKDVADLLLAHNADVNTKDYDGFTPLHSAAVMSHKDMVELLRRHGGHE